MPEAKHLQNFQLLKPVNSLCVLSQSELSSVSCTENSRITQLGSIEEIGCSCFASILNQLPLMLKDPAPLTSSRKPPRDLPISYDLPIHGPSLCLVGVSPQALTYCAVSRWVLGLGDETHPGKTWQGLQPSGPMSAPRAVRAWAGPWSS